MSDAAANEPTVQVQTAPVIPPMMTAIDKRAFEVIHAGLGELPGKIGAPYMVLLEQQWNAHVQKHTAAAQAQAKADEELRRKAAEPPPASRAQRRAAAKRKK